MSFDLAIPEVLYPTATYAPGMDIPDRNSDEYGAYLLSSTAEFFGYFSRYQSMGDLWKITLWSCMTHIRHPQTKRLLVPMVPRLITLGESGSGKSTDLELLNLVCANTDGLASEPTEPAFRSMLGPEQLDVLLDEADILFNTGKRKAAIRTMLNASCYPNGHTDRIQGGVRVKDNIYGAVAIAALPTMEVATGSQLDTLFNRAHKIYKVKPKEAIPQILEDPEGQMLGIYAGKMLEMWVQSRLEQIVDTIPKVQMPRGIDPHRDAQKWKAMMAIAQVAGGLWPKYAEQAALGVKDDLSLRNFRTKLGALRG